MSLIIAKNKVEFSQLKLVETPEATETHTPIPHHTLVEMVKEAMKNMGLTIVEEEYALAAGGQRMFAGFAVTGTDIFSEDRQVVVGLRNSHDKAFAASICLGSKMMVCENLCFSSDFKLARKHTTNILRDLPTVIHNALSRIVSHWNDMENRINAYKAKEITVDTASRLIFELAAIGAITKRKAFDTYQEFVTPRHQEFEGSTLWTLYNAITEMLKGSDMNKLAYRTMTVQAILDPLAGHCSEFEPQEFVIDPTAGEYDGEGEIVERGDD